MKPKPILEASLIFLSALCLAGCAKDSGTLAGERVWVVPTPGPELVLTVTGQVGHRRTEPVKAPVADLRLAWMASEGELVEAGDVVVRYDTELLDLWLQSNREELAILERRTRAAEIANERFFYELRAQLLDSEREHKAVALAYELSKDRDLSERGILERELELARESLADARETLETLQELQTMGGATAAEVREAMAAYERALASVRVPEVNLAVFDEEDGRKERMELHQDLARLGLALGTESQHGSLRSRIAIAMSQKERDLFWVKLENTRLNEEAADARKVIDDATHRTEKGGVIEPEAGHFPVPLVTGAELGERRIGNVISSEESVIKVLIPEALREAVRIKGEEAYRTQVRIPSMGPEWHAGRLQSVSVVKQKDDLNEPAYQAVVVLDSMPGGLIQGAGVECRIKLPVPAPSVIIPRWWATRAFRPVVRMADGEQRRLHAQVVGDWLMVSDGLAVGDRILPPKNENGRNLVLYGTVEVPESEEVTIGRTRSWEWVVEEIVDDGSLVAEDQVVARLRRAHGRETREDAAEVEQLKADAARQLTRMAANGRLGTAFMNWQEARIDAEVSRMKYEIDRQTIDKAGIVQGEVGARLASIQRKQLEEEHERLSDPIYDEIRSADQRSRDRLEARVARMEDGRATLTSASTAHYRDWPATWSKRQEWRRLSAIELTFEQAYKRAQNTHRREITAAEAQYTRRMEHVEQLRLLAGQREIKSPVSGRVYHNASAYRPIEVGRRLPTGHLFNIPRGLLRRFELHVPARRYQDFSVGQDLSFYLPAEGARRRVGRIIHIADFFEKRTTRHRRHGRRHRFRVRDEDQPDTVETTFRIKVEFKADHVDAAPPGMTAVVELDA